MTEPNTTRCPRRRKAVVVAVLVLAVIGIVAWQMRRAHDRPPPAAAEPLQPVTPAEDVRRQAQAAVSERMNDPAYRDRLDRLADQRRPLAAQAVALREEIEAWQQAQAATNAAFASDLAKLAALRQQTNNVQQAAIEAQAQAVDDWMARDPQGRILLSRRKDLDIRRSALIREVKATIARRMQQQADRPAPTTVEAVQESEK